MAKVAKSKKIDLVGASHARRVAAMMTGRGITSHLIETGHWRATKQEVSKLLADIKTAIGDLPSDEVAIVLFMLDNAYYKARAEDGNLIPHSRDITGKYHIYGDVLGAPMESNKQVLLQLVPLIKALQDYDKIVMTPLPRYLWSNCCDDPNHAPNISSVDQCWMAWRAYRNCGVACFFVSGSTSKFATLDLNWRSFSGGWVTPFTPQQRAIRW
jgi:hypothetical protein